MNNILRNVLMRRSTMQFDSRPIRDEAMMEILEEGKTLSNAPNNHEWHFTVLQNRGLLRRFHELYERLVEEHLGRHAIPKERLDIAKIYRGRSAIRLDLQRSGSGILFVAFLAFPVSRGDHEFFQHAGL